MIELRCDSKMHGKILEELIEVRCTSRWCGAEKGIVVLHKFDLHGKLVETVKYKSPTREGSRA